METRVNIGSLIKVLLWITIFGIAMAYLESAVVIYLRGLYYPYGFGFPMPAIDRVIGLTELGREIATIVMLVAISVLIGKSHLQRFGYFLYIFAIWDIFYYVFLKWLINWPITIFEWDVLFLIPVVWASPVFYPVLVSFTMIILGLFFIVGTKKNKKNLTTWHTWTLLISGSVLILLSFTLDNLLFLLKRFALKDLLVSYDQTSRLLAASNYIPGPFKWELFFIGELIIIGAIVYVGFRFCKLTTGK